MDKTYYLDLITLVESLYQQTATLSTRLPRGVPGVSEACTALVRVQNGKVVESVIESKRGIRVEGSKAFHYLSEVDEWQVRLETERVEPPMTLLALKPLVRSMPAMLDGVPRQLVSFNPIFVQDLPARERMVLQMVLTVVNGQRSVSQIKEQLRLPSDAVDWALSYLQRLRVIA